MNDQRLLRAERLKVFADIEDKKQFEYWKRVTNIMMIRVGYQNANIVTAAQCTVNIVKRDMDSCWRSGSTYSLEIIQHSGTK